MEFGFGQEDDVRRLLDARAPGLRLERIREDLQGLARTVVARTCRGSHGRSWRGGRER
jgi:hypothetical protein